ncbi:31353_t:CDS:2 [Gigaspora margarita]|uniref:31353_t:CDS:1 n=1 Tax=Gigaspora margarita TaxID=4874 RepID=A0ABN7VA85_GIGMA|nr:31353_t:CDS:2 [Gigaspora margarita]
MYSVLLAGHDSKTSDEPDSKDPKKKHASEISLEEAEEKAMKTKLYVKILIVKMFSKKEVYTKKLENYHKRYEDNDLYSSLEELYELYYHIAKEKNCKRSDNKIEQMLKAMAI